MIAAAFTVLLALHLSVVTEFGALGRRLADHGERTDPAGLVPVAGLRVPDFLVSPDRAEALAALVRFDRERFGPNDTFLDLTGDRNPYEEDEE